MPELPEVETVVRDLRPLLIGRVLSNLRRSKQRLRTPWQSSWQRSLRGRTIVRIDRRGKWIVIVLDDEARLLVHLGMTGQFCVMDANTSPALPTLTVKGTFQFCRRACRVPHGTKAELLPSPALHRYV